MTSTIKLFSVSLIVTLLVGGGILYAVNHTEKDSVSEDTASTVSSEDAETEFTEQDSESTQSDIIQDSQNWVTLSNEYFSMDFPDTWESTEKNSTNNGQRQKGFFYGNEESGDYMVVLADMADMGLGSVDQVWYWKVNDDGTGVVIDKIDEKGLTWPEDVHGDGELSIIGRHTLEFSEQEINGHTYFFRFGNKKQEENASVEMFKRMLTSFHAES